MNNAASWKMAASATIHCLTGCAIGEVAGMVIGTWLGWSNINTIILAITLAFLSGYSLSTLPLMRKGMGFISSLKLVFAADTLSIAVMEIVDNLTMWVIPGAMNAHVDSWHFWVSLGISLVVAFIAAWPVNYLLIKRGKGHALTHDHAHSDHAHH
jgi:hypothetical protein